MVRGPSIVVTIDHGPRTIRWYAFCRVGQPVLHYTLAYENSADGSAVPRFSVRVGYRYRCMKVRSGIMAVKFGVFVPQGWKMDLIGIPDPAEQYEAMTRVARAADEGGFDSIWV